ncbi:MAG: STAS domain-containing protein [Pseudomonadota bacterium]
MKNWKVFVLVRVVEERLRGVPVIFLSGDFKASDTQAFHHTVFDFADRVADDGLIIDVTNLTWACSGTLRVLALVQRKLSVLGARLIVTGMSGPVREVFDLCKLSGLIETRACPRKAALELQRPS